MNENTNIETNWKHYSKRNNCSIIMINSSLFPIMFSKVVCMLEKGWVMEQSNLLQECYREKTSFQGKSCINKKKKNNFTSPNKLQQMLHLLVSYFCHKSEHSYNGEIDFLRVWTMHKIVPWKIGVCMVPILFICVKTMSGHITSCLCLILINALNYNFIFYVFLSDTEYENGSMAGKCMPFDCWLVAKLKV